MAYSIADIHAMNPFRSPQWRVERALKMTDHRPHPLLPRRSDDKYVRAYRYFALAMRAADGDTEKENEVVIDQPYVFYAHLCHFHPDREWHAIMQAALLTGDSDDEIASRWHTAPEIVHYYEKIFYNVRDRLDADYWILKTIMGSIASRAANKMDSLTDDQKFFLWRLFAYYGGHHALQAAVGALSSQRSRLRASEVADWTDNVMTSRIKTRAGMAAQVFEQNKFNVMQLLELGVALIKSAEEDGGAQSDVERRMANMLNSVHWTLASKDSESPGQLSLGRAIEPRAMEAIALANNVQPATLIQDESRMHVPTAEPVVEGATQ